MYIYDSSRYILLVKSRGVRIYFYNYQSLIFFYTEIEGRTVNCALYTIDDVDELISILRPTYLGSIEWYIKNIKKYINNPSLVSINIEDKNDVPYWTYGCTFYYNLQYFLIDDISYDSIFNSFMKSQTLNWNRKLPNIVQCSIITYKPTNFDLISVDYNSDMVEKFYYTFKNIYYSLSISYIDRKMMCTINSFHQVKNIDMLNYIGSVRDIYEYLDKTTCSDTANIVLQYLDLHR